jgi:hypothetical protein
MNANRVHSCQEGITGARKTVAMILTLTSSEVLEPKPGLPTDPNSMRAFMDVFTDSSGLFVINNESGWCEGWMIHDLRVAPVASPLSGGRAQFGTITASDAAALQAKGSHHNVPGEIFTVDGNAVHFPSSTDHFPDRQINVVPIQLSMGAWNTLQSILTALLA